MLVGNVFAEGFIFEERFRLSMLKYLTLAFALGSIFSCRSQHPVRNAQSPYPKREFRAVWIATVENIDWPSRGNYTPEKQQQELRDILDAHQRTGINAVLVQVRDAADAFYAKSPEPWSEWLTGKQGKAPEPFYDPLEFMITESHQRGMEFHAWLNLNRAAFKTAKSIAPDHISKRKPEWILTYDGMKLLNFGIPEVRQYITDVVVNIVKNYDVDGIHFDDYFYPYTVANETLKDQHTFREYPNGFDDIEDWRRNNTDLLIKQIAEAIKATKPYVKFGISPFGVWRNRKDSLEGSATAAGQTSYDNLYADTRKWVEQGWIDYIAPQNYFSRGFKLVPYQNLTLWWTQNSYDRHLYIGQAAYRLGRNEQAWQNLSEIGDQIRFNRSLPVVKGSIFFSSKSLTNNQKGLQDSLRTRLYRYPALVPSMPWKDNVPPLSPRKVEAHLGEDNTIFLHWDAPEKAADGGTAHYYVVYRFEKGEEPSTESAEHIVGICQENSFADTATLPDKKYLYFVTAVDRLHNESIVSNFVKIKSKERITTTRSITQGSD